MLLRECYLYPGYGFPSVYGKLINNAIITSNMHEAKNFSKITSILLVSNGINCIHWRWDKFNIEYKYPNFGWEYCNPHPKQRMNMTPLKLNPRKL